MNKGKEPRKNTRNNQQNNPNEKKAPNPQRLTPVVGEPWPKATEVKPKHSGTERLRGDVLIGLVLLTGALLIALAGYAFINKDDRMILEILGFVKMFLSGVGGWAIGRSRK